MNHQLLHEGKEIVFGKQEREGLVPKRVTVQGPTGPYVAVRWVSPEEAGYQVLSPEVLKDYSDRWSSDLSELRDHPNFGRATDSHRFLGSVAKYARAGYEHKEIVDDEGLHGAIAYHVSPAGETSTGRRIAGEVSIEAVASSPRVICHRERRGVGTALMYSAIREGLEKGASSATLRAGKDAQPFHEKLGFRFRGENGRMGKHEMQRFALEFERAQGLEEKSSGGWLEEVVAIEEETGVAVIPSSEKSIEKQEGQKSGLVPRKKVVEREGTTFEETYWVSADWFSKPENLKELTNDDLRATFKGMESFLDDRHQSYADAIKRGAPKEELEKLHTNEDRAYWGRRYVGRELKSREIPFDTAPVRTSERQKVRQPITREKAEAAAQAADGQDVLAVLTWMRQKKIRDVIEEECADWLARADKYAGSKRWREENIRRYDQQKRDIERETSAWKAKEEEALREKLAAKKKKEKAEYVVRRIKEGKPPEIETVPEPSGLVARLLGQVGMTSDEKSRFGKEISPSQRKARYHEFLTNRGLSPEIVEGSFTRGWGALADAPLVVNAAVGILMGYKYDDVARRIPKFARSKRDRATLEKGAETVGEVMPAIATWSQNHFRSQGKETVMLYRGLPPRAAGGINHLAGDPRVTRVDIGTNPVSMWTTDEEAARAHAQRTSEPKELRRGALIKVEVPIERVVYASEATKELEPGELPEVLITTSFDEALRLPKEDIESIKARKLV